MSWGLALFWTWAGRSGADLWIRTQEIQSRRTSGVNLRPKSKSSKSYHVVHTPTTAAIAYAHAHTHTHMHTHTPPRARANFTFHEDQNVIRKAISKMPQSSSRCSWIGGPMDSRSTRTNCRSSTRRSRLRPGATRTLRTTTAIGGLLLMRPSSLRCEWRANVRGCAMKN